MAVRVVEGIFEGVTFPWYVCAVFIYIDTATNIRLEDMIRTI